MRRSARTPKIKAAAANHSLGCCPSGSDGMKRSASMSWCLRGPEGFVASSTRRGRGGGKGGLANGRTGGANQRGVGEGRQRRVKTGPRFYGKKLLTNGAGGGPSTPHRRLTDGRGRRGRRPFDPMGVFSPAVVDPE